MAATITTGATIIDRTKAASGGGSSLSLTSNVHTERPGNSRPAFYRWSEPLAHHRSAASRSAVDRRSATRLRQWRSGDSRTDLLGAAGARAGRWNRLGASDGNRAAARAARCGHRLRRSRGRIDAEGSDRAHPARQMPVRFRRGAPRRCEAAEAAAKIVGNAPEALDALRRDLRPARAARKRRRNSSSARSPPRPDVPQYLFNLAATERMTGALARPKRIATPPSRSTAITVLPTICARTCASRPPIATISRKWKR